MSNNSNKSNNSKERSKGSQVSHSGKALKGRKLGHTPYGYRIENGIAVICEEEATQVRKVYEYYLSGLALMKAAEEAGLHITHSSVKKMLRNVHYLGDEFYPAIIDRDTFDAFEAELQRRAEVLGRNNKKKTSSEEKVPFTNFRMARQKLTFCDPYGWAEYVYSLIENVGTNTD